MLLGPREEEMDRVLERLDGAVRSGDNQQPGLRGDQLECAGVVSVVQPAMDLQPHRPHPTLQQLLLLFHPLLQHMGSRIRLSSLEVVGECSRDGSEYFFAWYGKNTLFFHFARSVSLTRFEYLSVFEATSTLVNFWFSLVCIMVIGATSGFGESVILGMLKHYRSDLVGGWSSGTGMAGIAGSGLYFLFDAFDFPLVYTYLVLVPTAYLYFGCFQHMLTSPEQADAEKKAEALRNDREPKALVEASEGTIQTDDDRVAMPIETGLQRNWRCFKVSFWLCINLFLVYFFEYVASTGKYRKFAFKSFELFISF